MTFSEQFIQVMDEVFRRVGIMVDWTSQNIVPYLVDFSERFIQYEIFKNAILGLSILIAFIFTLIMTFIGVKRSWDLGLILFGMITAIMGFGCLIMLPHVIHNIIQATFIPEITIIEQLMILIQ